MVKRFPQFDTREILRHRGPRNELDPQRPYAFLVEPEHSAHGEIVDVATLFLTNNECPYHCLMCDLWQNTLPRNTPAANMPSQIAFALGQLPPAREIKLYNSGNFFDAQAIPTPQHAAIAEMVRHFETVVVENHPKLIGEDCLAFRDAIAPAQLEIAMGLETCHPEVLASLNKGMTLDDYLKAAKYLKTEQIRMRTFILLKPPFLSEEEGIEWALRSIDFAFEAEIDCCSLVPTRGGNGIMEHLQGQRRYSPPSGDSMEYVLEEGIKMQRGRVFMDLWDAEKFFTCESCRQQRVDRLREMNLRQTILPAISCPECKL